MEGRSTELTGVVVRTATEDDVDLLGPVELAAGALFRTVGMESVADDPPPPRPVYAEAVRREHVWVAEVDGTVVGYAWGVRLTDGGHHLEQLSVVPEHNGRGIGSALVHRVVEWAQSEGASALTLSTFVDVPFNAPWYERRGFVVVGDDEVTHSPAFSEVRAHESAAGLDISARVIMRRPLQVG